MHKSPGGYLPQLMGLGILPVLLSGDAAAIVCAKLCVVEPVIKRRILDSKEL